MMKPPFRNLSVRPTGGSLGAWIDDLDLAEGVSGEASELREALWAYSVLFFRGQSLSERQQVEFSRVFGTPEPHVRSQKQRQVEEVFVISNVVKDGERIGALGAGELTFHSDLSYMSRPGAVSIVHAIEVPSRGGETHWSSGYAAYNALDEGTKRSVAGLRAVHRHGEEEQNPPELVDHPIVRTHPFTGRKSLYVSPQFTRRIVGADGLGLADRTALLDRLIAQTCDPRFYWTHHWQRGDVVVWDNRCTHHRREPFDPSERRVLKRTQMFGEVPV